jgi:hypothetical protein
LFDVTSKTQIVTTSAIYIEHYLLYTIYRHVYHLSPSQVLRTQVSGLLYVVTRTIIITIIIVINDKLKLHNFVVIFEFTKGLVVYM